MLREQGIEMKLVPITGSIFAECSSGTYEACMFTDSASHPAQMYELKVARSVPESLRRRSRGGCRCGKCCVRRTRPGHRRTVVERLVPSGLR